MNSENNYADLFRTNRIVGSMLTLIVGVFAVVTAYKIQIYADIFEGLVSGGVKALPVVSGFLIAWRLPLMALLTLITISSLCFTWVSGSLSRVTMGTGIAVSMLVGFILLITFSMQQPLITIISKFQE